MDPVVCKFPVTPNSIIEEAVALPPPPPPSSHNQPYVLTFSILDLIAQLETVFNPAGAVKFALAPQPVAP